MKEKLLYYVWSTGRYRKESILYTTTGEKLEIIEPGIPTKYGGADFQNAHIRLNGVDWYGAVEIHIQSADWYHHGHETNSSYTSIILHVVWEDNRPAKTNTNPNKLIPTLELKNFVEVGLLERYQELMENSNKILCKRHLKGMKVDKNWHQTVSIYAKKRLQRKKEHIIDLWKSNQENADATAYQLLAEHFGFKANNEAFRILSSQVPVTAIQAHKHQGSAIEALLLGQAGFLQTQCRFDSYAQELSNLYQKLSKRYRLPAPMAFEEWRFCQLRPPNFPTIRIAQLASILALYPAIFHFLLNINSEDMYEKLGVQQSTYWQSHYFFNQESSQKIAGLGRSSIRSLVINTVVPLLVACGELRYESFYLKRAIKILTILPPENNTIIREWRKEGIKPQNALESQGAIELYQQLCTPKKCVECPIGQEIIS